MLNNFRSVFCSGYRTVLLIVIVMGLNSITVAQNLLNSPQKLVVDSAHERYLVSNFGNGSIVQIDYEGNHSVFLEGQNFIDGMTILGNTLYGACGTEVKAVNLETGAVTAHLTIPGIQHLSSIEADADGNLYLSDRFGPKIIKVGFSPKMDWEIFAEGQGLQNPNGIYFDQPNNRLVICLDKGMSKILAIDMTTRAVSVLRETSMSDLDGILKGPDGNFYVTGYYLPGIYKFDPQFSNEPELVYEGTGIVYPTVDTQNEKIFFTRYDDNAIGSMTVVTSVDEQVGQLKGFELHQNFPNPFNPSTTLKFDIAKTMNTQLDVFDLTGKKVKTLLDNNEVKPGSYSIQWNGRDDKGMAAASGIYFFRLTANNFVQSRKAVLLK